MPDPSSAAAAASDNASIATDSTPEDGNDDVALDRIVLEAMENERDRVMILQFESQIETFVKDDTRTRLVFPPMSSYHRLILHRIAQFYKIDHPSQLLPDGKRQILLVKQNFSRIPRIRICDMDISSSGTNGSPSSNPIQVAAPPMRIMRRAQVEDKPEQIQAIGLTESELSLQSREEAYAKARAKLFEFDQSSQDDSSVSDIPFLESRTFEIEPHEHDLYRRNVGLYNRISNKSPSMYNISQPGMAHQFQPHWAYCRTGIPPMPQSSALGPMYWSRAAMLSPVDNRAYIPFYEPAQSRQDLFSPSVPPFFANTSNIEGGSWSLNNQNGDDAKADYSFCTSMLEIYDLPKDAKNYQVDIILDTLKQRNCSLKWIADGRVIAVFETASDALEALQTVTDPRYKLRPWSGAM